MKLPIYLDNEIVDEINFNVNDAIYESLIETYDNIPDKIDISNSHKYKTLYNNSGIIVLLSDSNKIKKSLRETYWFNIPEDQIERVNSSLNYNEELHKYPIIKISNDFTNGDMYKSKLIIKNNIITKNFTNIPELKNKKFITNKLMKLLIPLMEIN